MSFLQEFYLCLSKTTVSPKGKSDGRRWRKRLLHSSPEQPEPRRKDNRMGRAVS
jgi:hypothetical protein